MLGKKVRVPQNISVAGFDDSWFAVQGPLGLTTVRQPLEEMAERAVERLVNMLIAAKKVSRTKTILPTELIVRESCAPPLEQTDFYQ